MSSNSFDRFESYPTNNNRYNSYQNGFNSYQNNHHHHHHNSSSGIWTPDANKLLPKRFQIAKDDLDENRFQFSNDQSKNSYSHAEPIQKEEEEVKMNRSMFGSGISKKKVRQQQPQESNYANRMRRSTHRGKHFKIVQKKKPSTDGADSTKQNEKNGAKHRKKKRFHVTKKE
mmetsp:Transcript_8785/g.13022  ORF Transcript_8785/g.13022 Transcript_8785/m.13022 type:complete len:172 (+) Transcript_8785:383-898(+)